MRHVFIRLFAIAITALLTLAVALRAQRQMENLDRGVIAINQGGGSVYVGWRLLGTESVEIAFNLYRASGSAAAVKLNAQPLTQSTNFVDTGVDTAVANAYFVRPVLLGTELAESKRFTLPAGAPARQYLSIPLTPPAIDPTIDGGRYSYSPCDTSTGDLDGDGEYELVVKWDPSNSKDNSQSGSTGNVFLDAYKLDGRRLWRIDLGRNIRAGAHYTQFMVYDLDGDGRAEIACKTADGTIDGLGHVIGDATADYRTSAGYVLSGPEFLTVFDGHTGAALATTAYVPARNNNPASTDVSAWGDNYGNRVDRFLACVAYLDGVHPSLVMCRGYYTRAVLAAWDWREGQLTQRWVFDSDDGTPGNTAYRGQGDHQLSVGDVDDDGCDEIVYGSCAIDHDGRGLYVTGLGHGDAMHLSDLDPDRPGLEVWQCHEDSPHNGGIGLSFRDARTGERLWTVPATGDTGRAVAIDIDPRYPGYECWGAVGDLYTAKGVRISTRKPSSTNFAVWWDGDLLREILDSNRISKWNWLDGTETRLLTADNCTSNNSTKSTPCLSADLFGDWREEVVWRSTDNRELRIYTTTIPTTNRLYTLMHDPQYRLAIAWQNTAYNQPPHPGFFLGDGMKPAPRPNISITPPHLATQPMACNLARGARATFSVAAESTAPLAYQWRLNGQPIAGATAASLVVDPVEVASAGQYSVRVTDFVWAVISQPAILSVATTAKVTGAATEVGPNIVHPNGHTYDQVLLEGRTAAVTADPGQVLRLSYVDLTDDIVQVEFSGAGSLALTLENPSGPAAPVNYNQSTAYMKGHAGIVISGADETTNVSVFSVGRVTAVNQTLFRSDVAYDGHADLAFIAIASANGKFGGVRTANANYLATKGLTGIYAPGVEFLGPVYAGDITASDTAQPVLVLGSGADVRITGGNLSQPNGRPVEVAGFAHLNFTAGTTSHDKLLPAQINQGYLEQNGVNVTATLVGYPTP
jgi:rhamnogalacturonan endolyase